MTNIISLNKKRVHKKVRADQKKKEHKILAVQKVFQCIRCTFKCEKCGNNIDLETEDNPTQMQHFHIPYNFCKGCKEEYVEYVLYQKGKHDPEDYWHNDPWAVLWEKWVAYQAAMDGYLKSKEFKQLLSEFNDIQAEEED